MFSREKAIESNLLSSASIDEMLHNEFIDFLDNKNFCAGCIAVWDNVLNEAKVVALHGVAEVAYGNIVLICILTKSMRP